MSNEEIASLFSKIDQTLAGIEQHGKQHKLDQAAIEDIQTETTEERRALMQYRLDELYRAIYPLTQRKSNPQLQLAAIDRILEIMRLEAALWGLNKPPQELKPRVQVIIREAQEQRPAIVA